MLCWGSVYLDMFVLCMYPCLYFVLPQGPFWTWCLKDMKDEDVTVDNVSKYVARATKRYLKLCLAM